MHPVNQRLREGVVKTSAGCAGAGAGLSIVCDGSKATLTGGHAPTQEAYGAQDTAAAREKNMRDAGMSGVSAGGEKGYAIECAAVRRQKILGVPGGGHSDGRE